MSDKLTPEHWIENTKGTWGFVAQFAVFIIGVVSSFLLGPPGWAATTGDRTLVRLGQFIVTVLVGLVFLLVRRWNKKAHVGRWVLLAVVSLAFSISAFFSYQHFLDTRTCPYADEAVVIGTVYTTHAQSYLGENPNSTCTSLLGDFIGKTDDIWTKDSINRSRYVLAGTYILNLPLFTICIISVVQAIYCSGQGKRGRKSTNKSRKASV